MGTSVSQDHSLPWQTSENTGKITTMKKVNHNQKITTMKKVNHNQKITTRKTSITITITTTTTKLQTPLKSLIDWKWILNIRTTHAQKTQKTQKMDLIQSKTTYQDAHMST